MLYSGKVLRGASVEPFLEATFNRPVVTLGFFDGVHLGHQVLLREVISLAQEKGGEPIAVTFKRHPKEVLTGKGPLLITPTIERERLLLGLGLTVVELEFTKELAAISAEDFVKDFFVGMLNVSTVVLGPETRFGHRGAGGPELLHSLGEKLGFNTKIVDFKKEEKEVISSSLIRDKILSGDIAGAEKMLGRPVTLVGKVTRGKGRGKEIGFPTANLDVRGLVIPPHGIYAARVSLNGEIFSGALNIGVAPTFGDLTETAFEVYVIGISRELYGENLRTEILSKIRDEKKFPDLESLKRAIAEDVEEVLRRR